MRRLYFSEARDILNRHCRDIDGKDPSSNHTASAEKNEAAASPEWWTRHKKAVPPADSPRSRAYLRAYCEIAQGSFFAMGIPLRDGYLLPDRGVMKALLLERYVRLSVANSPNFELTERGCALISSKEVERAEPTQST